MGFSSAKVPGMKRRLGIGRFALVTGLFALAVSAVLLWLSLVPKVTQLDLIEFLPNFPDIPSVEAKDAIPGRQYLQSERFGWPLEYRYRSMRVSVRNGEWVPEPPETVEKLRKDITAYVDKPNWSISFDKGDIFRNDFISSMNNLILDSVIGVAILAVSVLVFGFLVGRLWRPS